MNRPVNRITTRLEGPSADPMARFQTLAQICQSKHAAHFTFAPAGYLVVSCPFEELGLAYGDESVLSEHGPGHLVVLAERFVVGAGESLRTAIRSNGGATSKYAIFGLDLHDTGWSTNSAAIVEFIAMVSLHDDSPVQWCAKTHILAGSRQMIDACVERKIRESVVGTVGLLVCNDMVVFGGRSQVTRRAGGIRNALADNMMAAFKNANLRYVFNPVHALHSRSGSLVTAAGGLRKYLKLSAQVPIIQAFATSATGSELGLLRQNTGGSFCNEYVVD